ncbi:hypothetical protein QOZ80_5AG0403570 [Eleusine coracana subsp. coracana]|nr:hypothetical protein QOZ80_5AG0403570 [Eleusine coracana subsp. coracana]
MPPPKAKPGGVETIGAMPPQHRAKGSLLGRARSSGGGGMPPKDSGKGTGVIPVAATAGTGSTGDLPLANLSNLAIGSPRPRRYLPAITGSVPRGAGEKKHTRAPRVPSLPKARSNTPSPRGSPRSVVKKNTYSPRGSPLSRARSNTPSPRDSSLRTVQLTSSFASLSVNNVETPISPSPDAHLGDTAACSGREPGTSHRTMEKSGRSSSVIEVSRRPHVTARTGVGLAGRDALQKPHLTAKTVAGMSGGDAQQRPGLAAKTGAGLTMEIARKPLGSIGKMAQKSTAVTDLNGETRRRNHAVKSLKVEIQKEHCAEQSGRGLNGETQKRHYVLKSGRGLNGQRLQNSHTVAGLHGEAPPKKHAVTGSNGKNQEYNINKSCRRSSGKMPQKKHRKKETLQCEELSADEKRQLEDEMLKNVQEAEHAIQQLNKLGLGEDISYEEFEVYLEQLPNTPCFDDSIRPGYDQLGELQICNILYRIKYCKFIQQMRNNDQIYNAELEDDHPLYHLVDKLESLGEDVTKLKGNHLLDYLHKEGLLREIENDEIFDWSFLRPVAGLDDYQRLVPQNYGDCGYVNWAIYRGYFHSYKVELEYLSYWEELLKNLKWMEDYVLMERPSLTWGKICTRGCYQAIKIASRFSNITESVARGAYYECIETMCLDICWYKELDGVYFEIWQQINKLKMTFRDALDSVYKLNKFPLQYHKMKDVLDDDVWSDMEKEFHICTTDITMEMTENIAREFIADAIKSQRVRPKYYAQYIKKKIKIAKILGIIPAEH